MLITRLHVSSRGLCLIFKTRSLGFLIQIKASEIHKGLFAVADEIFRESPGGLLKLEPGKGKEKKETQTWTQKSVLAARDVTLVRWPKRRKYLERTEKNKAEIIGFKEAFLTKSFSNTCKKS